MLLYILQKIVYLCVYQISVILIKNKNRKAITVFTLGEYNLGKAVINKINHGKLPGMKTSNVIFVKSM